MQLSDNIKIEKKKRQTFELYQSQFDRYISDSKKEVSTVKGYQGRELLELIQNAEDECEDRKGTLRITLEGNTLRIENSGNPFSYEGILSLMTANYSPKDSNNFIGNKGLGFRSVLSWSNSVSIFSSLLSVRFSRDDADIMQNELIKVIEAERLEKYKFDNYRIPIFSAPNTNIKYVNPSKDMDTLILLQCKDEAISRIKEQLDLINGKELLFLKNLGRIIIEQEDIRVFVIVDEPYKKTENDNLFFKNCLIETHEKNRIYEYNVYQSTGNLPYIDEDNNEKIKKYILSLAIPVGDAPSDENLYSFFRTNIKSPFRFILNATFELDDNRKYIFDNNNFNKQIISSLPQFIIESIIHNYSDRKNVSYDLLKELLIEDLNFLSSNGYNFKEVYLETLKKSKVFPTVNNKFIDYYAEPVLYKEPFAEILKGEPFDDLLQYTEDEKIITFCNTTLEGYSYEQSTMTEKINSVLNGLSTKNRVRLIKYFVDYYCSRSDKNNSFPYLLIDSKDESIESTSIKIYNQPKEEELNDIPVFIQIRFVNRKFFEEFNRLITFNDSKHKVREVIEQYLKYFGVTEYNFKALESTINSVSEQELSYKQTVDLIQWVYKCYKTQKSEDLTEIRLKLKLPINKKEMLAASKLYFSEKYENVVYCNFLKKATKAAKFIASKEIMGLESEKTESLIAFFSWLGVANRPRRISYKLSGAVLSEYKNFNDKTYSAYSGQVWSYEYFFDILNNLTTTEILKWVLDEQSNTSSIIATKSELSGSQLYYWHSRYYQSSRTDTYNLKSFVRWQLGLKNWVETKNNAEQKYALKDCLLENLDVSPYLYFPAIEYNQIKKYNSEYTETRINSLLEELGAKIKLADLSYDRFYELISKLKDIDKDMKITRRVYNTLFEKVDDYKELLGEIEDKDFYKNFLENGYVLTQIGRNKEFALAKNSVYSDRKDLCNGILNKMNILDMERKLGQNKIAAIFGIKTLTNTKVEIKDTKSHSLNNQFQELLKHIKPFLVVYRGSRNKQADLSVIKNLNITLCSAVKISYSINDSQSNGYNLSAYENIFSRDSKKAYLCVPDSESILYDLKNEYSFYESLSELLTIILNVSEGKEIYKNLIRDEIAVSQRAVEDNFGDRGLALLEQAKRDLGETESNEDAFWSIIKKVVKKSTDKIMAEYSVKLNYERINASENDKSIIELLKTLSLSVQQFNANSDGRFVISLVNYWNEQFTLLKSELACQYQAYRFSLIEKSNASDKYALFINEIRKYNFKKIESECNNIDFNIDKEFEKLFEVAIQVIKDTKEISINEIRTRKIEKFQAENKDKYAILLALYGNEKIQEVSLFNEFGNLSIEEPKQSQENTSIVREDKTSDIINAVDNSGISGKEVDTVPKEKQSTGSGNGGYSSNHSTDWRDISEKNEDTGFAAEKKVYNELCKIYKKENVNWVSTNAERGKIISKGCGKDDLHYDIAYLDNGVTRYVEVKGSSNLNDIALKISKAQYDFGNSPENINRYDIHYVIIDKETFKVKDYFIVKEFFRQRKDGRRKYELVQDTFTLLAKIEKEE